MKYVTRTLVLLISILFVIYVQKGFFLTKNTKEISLVFVGDIMLSRQIGTIIEREGSNFPFLKIKNLIHSADIAFANLENPVSDKGVDQGSVYSFRANPNVIPGLLFAGFDVLSLANNHILDWGNVAMVDTRERLEEANIKPIGAGNSTKVANTPAEFTISGTKISYLGYSAFAYPGSNVAGLDESRILSDIAIEKDRGIDVVIISLHWGNEYETKQTYYQERLAKSFIDHGATLVIGHHPHVVQDVEEYKHGLIAYSLGNFVFDQNFSTDTKVGLALRVFIKDKKIEKFEKVHLEFTNQFQPVIKVEG